VAAAAMPTSAKTPTAVAMVQLEPFLVIRSSFPPTHRRDRQGAYSKKGHAP
jgi:hypothetical protein